MNLFDPTGKADVLQANSQPERAITNRANGFWYVNLGQGRTPHESQVADHLNAVWNNHIVKLAASHKGFRIDDLQSFRKRHALHVLALIESSFLDVRDAN